MRAMMALALHLGGVGDDQESGDLHIYEVFEQIDMLFMDIHKH